MSVFLWDGGNQVNERRWRAANSADLFSVERRERFWFGWSDWAVVASVEKNNLPHLVATMDELKCPYCLIPEALGSDSRGIERTR